MGKQSPGESQEGHIGPNVFDGNPNKRRGQVGSDSTPSVRDKIECQPKETKIQPKISHDDDMVSDPEGGDLIKPAANPGEK